MENLEIIVLTAVISTLFLVFIIAIIREIKNIDENKYEKEGGPRANLVRFMERIFDSESLSIKQKQKVYKAIKRTISDMESDGVYFPSEIKNELDEESYFHGHS